MFLDGVLVSWTCSWNWDEVDYHDTLQDSDKPAYSAPTGGDEEMVGMARIGRPNLALSLYSWGEVES